VSSGVSPVTVTAEVDTNRASKKFVTVPVLDEIGNIRRAVPIRIKAVKAAAIDCVADSLGSIFIAGSNLLS
jgi:hypothetical protein